VTVMALGLALVAFAVAGVAVDGTRAFLARRTLQNAADAAVLAAASELDVDAYYSSSGRDIRLDPAAARAMAQEWLTLRGVRARARVDARADAVAVALRDEIDTTFLGIVGIARIGIAVRASAEPAAAAVP
jgi:Flp pilus assembly protein TadG